MRHFVLDNVNITNHIYNKSIESKLSYLYLVNAVERINNYVIENNINLAKYKEYFRSLDIGEQFRIGKEKVGMYFAKVFVSYMICNSIF